MIPQRPVGAHDEAALLPENPALLDPWTLAANVETFFRTSGLPQVGQVTAAALLLRTSFSKAVPQFGHTYSKIGILFYLTLLSHF